MHSSLGAGLLLLLVLLACSARADHPRGLPLSPEVPASKPLYFAPQREEVSQVNKTPPVWPFRWNATQAKINPFNSHIWWTKFYYDWPHGWTRWEVPLRLRAVRAGLYVVLVTSCVAGRTDFMNGYYNTEDKWTLNCSILFASNQVWMIFPDEQACFLDHNNLGTSASHGVGPTTYASQCLTCLLQSPRGGCRQGSTRVPPISEASTPISGPWKSLELTTMPAMMPPTLHVRAFSNLPDGRNALLTRPGHYPVRSTNQAEDPGATDYLDVVLGPQEPSLFKLPEYCKRPTTRGCPPDWP